MCDSGEQNLVYFQQEFVAWEVSEFLPGFICRACQSINDSSATRIFLSLNRRSLASYIFKPSCVVLMQ